MKTLWRLRIYLKSLWPFLLGSALLGIPLAFLRVSPVAFIKVLIDDMLVSKNATKLLTFPLLIIGIYVLNFLVRFFHYYLLRITIARVNQRVKNAICHHLLGLSADYFTTRSSGTLSARVGSDPAALDNGIACINILIREPFTLVFLLASTFYLNWRLTLITLGLIPVLTWVFSRTGKNSKRYAHRALEANAGTFSVLQEMLSGFRVIQLFGLQKYVFKRFRSQTDRFIQTGLKAAVLEEAAPPTVELMGSFAIAAVIYYGGSQVMAGNMSSGDLVAFFTAFFLMTNPVRLLNDTHMKLSQAEGAAERIFEVLEWKTHVPATQHPRPVPALKTGIRFENVSFAYPDSPEHPVLHHVSFEIPQGQVTALVGESGSGKTSIASLLPRLFDVSAGTIRWEEIPIRDFDLQELRANISVVSQDVFLFNDTVEENIRCGRRDATREEIREAAQRAQALHFIEKMPQGFGTVVGDRGQKLSGGERQRLSMARAFLRPSPLLILDEATSNLDTKSEKLVQEALLELMRDRTTLVIAHRLSTVRHAHQILLIRDGHIAEAGNHEALLEKGGRYAELFRST